MTKQPESAKPYLDRPALTNEAKGLRFDTADDAADYFRDIAERLRCLAFGKGACVKAKAGFNNEPNAPLAIGRTSVGQDATVLIPLSDEIQAADVEFPCGTGSDTNGFVRPAHRGKHPVNFAVADLVEAPKQMPFSVLEGLEFEQMWSNLFGDAASPLPLKLGSNIVGIVSEGELRKIGVVLVFNDLSAGENGVIES